MRDPLYYIPTFYRNTGTLTLKFVREILSNQPSKVSAQSGNYSASSEYHVFTPISLIKGMGKYIIFPFKSAIQSFDIINRNILKYFQLVFNKCRTVSLIFSRFGLDRVRSAAVVYLRVSSIVYYFKVTIHISYLHLSCYKCLPLNV